MSYSAASILRCARETLTPEGAWDRNCIEARTARGKECEGRSRRARTWSIRGAIKRSMRDRCDMREIAQALSYAHAAANARGFKRNRRRLSGLYAFEYSATTTHDDVLALLDDAIARAEEEVAFDAEQRDHARQSGVGDLTMAAIKACLNANSFNRAGDEGGG